ncbi:MAG: DUF4123 domain-containing protein [Acidobacteria bacterium]|nr:DUF4123 domain-containing protein [Acidobacteriota bacterium]
MEKERLADRIRTRLWHPDRPGGSCMYALVDGARDDRIYRAVVATYDNKACLYSGVLAPELEMTAPYLVELDSGSRFTALLLTEGWGRAWGLFLECDAGLVNLRKHLRQFLVVLDEKNTRLVFRYYDPRVLRAFLPTCTPRQLAQLFGPVQRWAMEDEDPEKALEFVREKGMVRMVRRNLAQPAEPPEVKQVASGVFDQPHEEG